MATQKNEQWIRELVPNVQYDEATKRINLPGGPSVPLSSTRVEDGKAMVSPRQISSWYASHQPQSKVTPEAVQQQTDIYQKAFEPLQDVRRQQIQQQLESVQQQADAQRRLAEAAYSQAQRNLERQETSDWNAITKSAMSRGLGASPLASYEQRQVAETYAPEFQQLETNQAADLSNIASQAASASEELALKGMELESQYYSQLAQAALNALNRKNEQQRQYAQQMSQHFANLGNRQSQERLQQAQLALQEAGVTGYYQGQPTLSRQEFEQQNAYRNAQLESGAQGEGGEEGSGLTPYQQYQVREEAVNLAQNDTRWYSATPQERQAIIDEYMDMLSVETQPQQQQTKGVAPIAYSGGTALADNSVKEMIEMAKQNGYSDAEIRAALKADGIDPQKYGF